MQMTYLEAIRQGISEEMQRDPDVWRQRRSEAERLIVRGFFQDVLDRIELEPVREAVTAALEARIPQG